MMKVEDQLMINFNELGFIYNALVAPISLSAGAFHLNPWYNPIFDLPSTELQTANVTRNGMQNILQQVAD